MSYVWKGNILGQTGITIKVIQTARGVFNIRRDSWCFSSLVFYVIWKPEQIERNRHTSQAKHRRPWMNCRYVVNRLIWRSLRRSSTVLGHGGSQTLRQHDRHRLHRPNHRHRLPLRLADLRPRQAGFPPRLQPRVGRLRPRCADNGLRQRLRAPAGSTFGPQRVCGLRRVFVSRRSRCPEPGRTVLQ